MVKRLSEGLKGYRYQEIEPTNDKSIDPGEEVSIDYDTYAKYIKNIAKRFYRKLPPNPRWDIDEFESEAWLALLEAKKYYKSEYNDSFKAFAYPYIITRLSEFMGVNMYTFKARYYNVKLKDKNIEKVNWLERTLWSESQTGDNSEENPMLNKPSGIPSTAELVANQEELDILKSIVNEELPRRERRAIIRRFRDGETYREIGERLHVSAETARKLVLRGLEIIKQRAENAGINSSQDM